MQVIILAAGFGTGMRPLSFERPKLLATVCNISLLRRLLEQLQNAGLSSADVVVRPSSPSFEKAMKADAPTNFQVNVIEVPNHIDGTLPCVRYALRKSARSCLVIYGDSLISADFQAFLDFHKKVRGLGSVATLLAHQPPELVSPPLTGRTFHGVLSVNNVGRVLRFKEKPDFSEIKPGFNLANAAVFVCEQSLFQSRKWKDAHDFSFDLFEKLCRDSSSPFFAYCIQNGFRHDVGSIARFVEANMRVVDQAWPARIPGSEVRKGVWVGENGSYRGATLLPPVCLGDDVCIGKGTRVGPHVVIGKGCKIESDAHISNSVLMEQCHVAKHAKIVQSVIGPHSKIAEKVNVPPKTILGAYSQVGDNSQIQKTP